MKASLYGLNVLKKGTIQNRYWDSFKGYGYIRPYDVKKGSDNSGNGTTATTVTLSNLTFKDTIYSSLLVMLAQEGGTVSVPDAINWNGYGLQVVGSVGGSSGLAATIWLASKIPTGTGDLYLSNLAQGGVYGLAAFQLVGLDWENPIVESFTSTSTSPGNTYDSIPGGMVVEVVIGAGGGNVQYGTPSPGTSISDGTNVIGQWFSADSPSETTSWTISASSARLVGVSLRPSKRLVIPVAAIR